MLSFINLANNYNNYFINKLVEKATIFARITIRLCQ
jgi:hypothetical protein